MFIAGDACHSHPPYGGFGLNSGLEDVANLGWKLTAVLNGWGGDALLDSYGEERRPIFVETGEAMIAGGIEADRAFLERYSPERDLEEFVRAWKALEGNARARQQSYEPHYEGSSVVCGPPNGVCSIHGTYAFEAQAGHHLTPQLLSSGRNVFEELDSGGFTLLALDADSRSFESTPVPLKVVRDSYAEGRSAYAARLILVRPDQYVVWAGGQPPQDVNALMERVTGNAHGLRAH